MSIPVPAKFHGKAAVSPAEAADLAGVNRATFYRHVMPYVYDGTIASVRIGGCRRILVFSLLAWLEREATEQRAVR